MPIGITVEGANILTRCLIIFGQGAFRSHPWVLQELAAAHDLDAEKSLRRFDRALFGHLGFVFANLGRSLLYGLSGARLAPAPTADANGNGGRYTGACRAWPPASR